MHDSVDAMCGPLVLLETKVQEKGAVICPLTVRLSNGEDPGEP